MMDVEKNKLIAFLIPSLSPGGMERVMSEVVNYISENKPFIECHLIIYSKPEIDFYKINENVRIYKPNFVFNDSKRVISTIKTIQFIRKTVKKINPDSVLSFGEYWNNLVLLSLYGLKYPIYISDRSSPNLNIGLIQEKLRKFLYPKSKGLIAQTQMAKDIFIKRKYNNNISVIGNPIRNIKNENEIDIVREKIVVSVGRLINTKNFDRLIDIFANINNKNWKLLIIGGDSDKQKNSLLLSNKIQDLGWKENIILTGTQRNIEDYLLRASVFVFTSNREGFPNVIGEAMSAGLPVVAYNCVAGPSEMIKDGENGFLIPLFDDQIFEEKLKYLMENEVERKRMGILAKKNIQKFSRNNIGEQFYQFIMKVKM